MGPNDGSLRFSPQAAGSPDVLAGFHAAEGPVVHERARPGGARLTPLVLATMASQALLVVLSPTIVAIGTELGASVGAVGQARSVTAGVAIVTPVALVPRIDVLGVGHVLRLGAALAITACAAVAMSTTLAVFLAAHTLVGLAFGCLLSAGFAGVGGLPAGAQGVRHRTGGGGERAGLDHGEPPGGADHRIPRLATGTGRPRGHHPGSAGGLARRRRGRGCGCRATLARRWIVMELIAYAAWSALLTFIGAFFIETLGVPEAAAGWLLASGAATYFAASTCSGDLAVRVPRRRLVAWSALVMAALLPVQLTMTRSVPLAVGVFCLIGFAAGIRTPASEGLGLGQVRGHPGAMMAARRLQPSSDICLVPPWQAR
jgi:predicted MFS family arabinose efflux permease